MAHKTNYSKEYYAKHREHLLELQRKYRNSEKGKAYYSRTREHRIQRQREYRKLYPEKTRESDKKYDDKNKDRTRAWNLAWVHKNAEKLREPRFKASRKARLKGKYGLTEEKYAEMFENQHGCCAICGKHQSILKKGLAIDHDHVTGKVRGLLCVNCNTMLGHINDNIDTLQKGIKYLEAQGELG